MSALTTLPTIAESLTALPIATPNDRQAKTVRANVKGVSLPRLTASMFFSLGLVVLWG